MKQIPIQKQSLTKPKIMTDLKNYFTNYQSNKNHKQAYFERCLKDFSVDLHEIVESAHQKTNDEISGRPSHYITRGLIAQIMYSNMIGLMKDNCDEDKKAVDDYGRDYLILAHDVRVYFKKLDGNKLPMNIPTEHVRKMNSQRLIVDEDTIHTLYIGYQLKEGTLDLAGIYVLCMNTYYPNQIYWIDDLFNYSKSEQRAAASIPAQKIVAAKEEKFVKTNSDKKKKAN